MTNYTLHTDTCVADIVFVVDESGSVGENNYDNLKEFIIEVISRLSPSALGHHVGLITFGNDGQLQFKLQYDALSTKVITIQRLFLQ